MLALVNNVIIELHGVDCLDSQVLMDRLVGFWRCIWATVWWVPNQFRIRGYLCQLASFFWFDIFFTCTDSVYYIVLLYCAICQLSIGIQVKNSCNRKLGSHLWE